MVGAFEQLHYLIRERDSKFTRAFDDVLASEDVKVIQTPVRAPKANAFAERLVGTFRREVGNGCYSWAGDISSGCSANTSGTTTEQDPTRVCRITVRLSRRCSGRRSILRMFAESTSSED
jgi:hypothetical protein